MATVVCVKAARCTVCHPSLRVRVCCVCVRVCCVGCQVPEGKPENTFGFDGQMLDAVRSNGARLAWRPTCFQHRRECTGGGASRGRRAVIVCAGFVLQAWRVRPVVWRVSTIAVPRWLPRAGRGSRRDCGDALDVAEARSDARGHVHPVRLPSASNGQAPAVDTAALSGGTAISRHLACDVVG